MSDVSKTEMALRIIAGIRPAWAHWNMFIDTLIPKRDRRVQSAREYQDRCGLLVRLAACEWLAERLDEGRVGDMGTSKTGETS